MTWTQTENKKFNNYKNHFVRCLISDISKACILVIIMHTLSCKIILEVFSYNIDNRSGVYLY